MAEILVTASTREAIYLNTLSQRIVRADVWLRMVASGEIPIDGSSRAAGTPSYADGVEREARGVDG
jgi:hypothetical protein